MRTQRLYRSTRESRIAGVCGGIAGHLDVDPVVVRLAFVALTIAAPPVGVLAYVAAWIIIPLEPSPEPPVPSPDPAAAPGPSSFSGPAPPPPPPQPEPAPPDRPAPPGPLLQGPAFGGAVLIAFGLALLMLNLGLFDWGIFRFVRWRTIWPTALIACGVWLLARGLRPARGRGEGGHVR